MRKNGKVLKEVIKRNWWISRFFLTKEFSRTAALTWQYYVIPTAAQMKPETAIDFKREVLAEMIIAEREGRNAYASFLKVFREYEEYVTAENFFVLLGDKTIAKVIHSTVGTRELGTLSFVQVKRIFIDLVKIREIEELQDRKFSKSFKTVYHRTVQATIPANIHNWIVTLAASEQISLSQMIDRIVNWIEDQLDTGYRIQNEKLLRIFNRGFLKLKAEEGQEILKKWKKQYGSRKLVVKPSLYTKYWLDAHELNLTELLALFIAIGKDRIARKTESDSDESDDNL